MNRVTGERKGLTMPLIIQYFLSRQLACPYFIRAAHGQNQFLEAPLTLPAEVLKSHGLVTIHGGHLVTGKMDFFIRGR